MVRQDSGLFTRWKKAVRPFLLPLLRKLGYRRTAKVPKLSARDLLPATDVPTRVSVREDQTILLNGRPFFPLGLYYSRDEIDNESGEGLVRLRAMGFNTIFFDGGVESAEALDRIWNVGLRVWYRPPGELQREFELLKQVVSKFARHPALLFWEMGDEPILNQSRIEDVEIGCRIVRSIDSFHPILCNQWLSSLEQAAEMRQWARLADVYGFSVYPVPPWRWGTRLSLVREGWPHSIAVVGRQTELWKTYAPGKPIIPVMQAWAWNCLEDGEAAYPTYRECRFMAYQAVIHGAKGLHHYGVFEPRRPYFACGIPPNMSADLEQTHADFLLAQQCNRRFWSYYSNIIRELARMSEVYTETDADWRLEIVERSSGQEGHEPRLEARVKRHADSFVILLVNASDAEVSASLRAAELRGLALNLWGQERSIQAGPDGVFRDVLEPYGVRIYSDQPDLLRDFSVSITSGGEDGRFSYAAREDA